MLEVQGVLNSNFRVYYQVEHYHPPLLDAEMEEGKGDNRRGLKARI